MWKQVRQVLENNKHWTVNCGSMLRDDSFGEEADEASNSTLLAAPSTSTTKAPLTPTPSPKRIVMQRDAPQDLDLVSWGAGKSLPRRLKGYVYDVLMGIDTYIYVIGGGINLAHRVSPSLLQQSPADLIHRTLCRADARAGTLDRMLNKILFATTHHHQDTRRVLLPRPQAGTMVYPKIQRSSRSRVLPRLLIIPGRLLECWKTSPLERNVEERR